MKGFHKILTALIVAVMISGCSTVTIKDKGKAKANTEPTWESSKSFFLWGLVGEQHIDLKEICGNRGVQQAQAQFTFVDGLLAVLTLGIYEPRTAKVWCNVDAPKVKEGRKKS